RPCLPRGPRPCGRRARLRDSRRRYAICLAYSSLLSAPHNVGIRETFVENAHMPREIVDRFERVLADSRTVERQVGRDDLGDQRGLVRREALLADFGRERHIGFQGVLRRDERATGASGDVARAVVLRIAHRQNRHRIIEAAQWTVAAPHIEDDRAEAARDRDLGRHAVRPKTVDLAALQSLRRGQPEIDAGPRGAGHWADADVVAARLEAGGGEEAAQPHLDPWRSADAATPERREIAARDTELRARNEEPV